MPINIYTDAPSKVVIFNDTLSTQNERVKIRVKRTKAPIEFTVINDSTKRTVLSNIKSRNSAAYLMNFYWNLGVGAYLERNNPKRYGYPLDVSVNTTSLANKRFRENHKKELYLQIGMPFLNFNRQTLEGNKINNSTNLFGISLALDYYHSKYQFFNLKFQRTVDFKPALDLFGVIFLDRNYIYNLSWVATHQHRLNRFVVGYGVAFNQNTIESRSALVTGHELLRYERNYTLGVTIPLRYYVSRRGYVGFNYQPSFWRFGSPSGWKYGHLIHLEVAHSIKF